MTMTPHHVIQVERKAEVELGPILHEKIGASLLIMVLSALVFVAGVPAVATAGYLGVLGALANPGASYVKRESDPSPLPFVTILVPAHNEAAGIARTIHSLQRVDYPAEKFQIVVIADNCSDGTKEQALDAGARVIERIDSEKRGKGYALEYAFELLISEARSDAVLVVDADTDVSPNILTAMALRFRNGEAATQAHYGVRNVEDSWRTRLMEFAFTLYHGVRSSARERLSLSAGLRGNGMGFTTTLLKQVPHSAHSLVEDVEFGVELGLRGIRVAYIGEARVLGEMVAEDAGSESQRERWEYGRQSMRKRYLATLIRRAVQERSLLLFDLALDLMTPPLTTTAIYTVLGSAVAGCTALVGLAHPVALVPWCISSAGLVIYIVRGVQFSPQRAGVLLDLLEVPKYAAWKIGLRLRKKAAPTTEWVRTTRQGE